MNSLILTIQNSSNVDSISLMAVIIVFIAFIIGWVVNRITLLRIRKNSMQVKDLSTIMQHTLNTSNNYVLKLSMQERYGVVFLFCRPAEAAAVIKDLLRGGGEPDA